MTQTKEQVSEKARAIMTAAIDAAIERGRVLQASDFNPDRARARREQEATEDALEALLASIEADAKRWQCVKAGLFVTVHNDGEAEVVYQSGSLDEVAAELYSELPKDERGIIWDITPVIDRAIASASASTGEVSR